MLSNKRGVAFLQVLIVTAILAGMATMILRATLSRTLTSRQTRHNIASQMVIESCMAEVNNLWASKKPETYQEDLAVCRMCSGCPGDNNREYHCTVKVPQPGGANKSYSVVAKFITATPNATTGFCDLDYTIVGGIDL